MRRSKGKRVGTIEAAKENLEARVMNLKGVAGTGITKVNGNLHIVVYVDELTNQLQAQIPRGFGGFPVVIERTGEVKAL